MLNTYIAVQLARIENCANRRIFVFWEHLGLPTQLLAFVQ